MTRAALSRVGWIGVVTLLAASVVSYVALTATLWEYTVDDAFITFRYADNLVRGWGLTFNHAPPRAEGYTSILWTLIMALPHRLGIDAVLFAKILGLGLTLGTVAVMTYGILAGPGRGLRRHRMAGAAFAAVLFLSFSCAPVHAISGMETALAALLYTVTTVLFLRARDGGRPGGLLPLTCLLLGLTRPEANLFSAVLLALVFLGLAPAHRRRFVFSVMACFLLPGALYFWWRAHYYQALLPLPFYIKSNSVGLAGLEPTLSFLKNILIGFALPVIAFAAAASGRRAWILLPVLCMLGYFVTIDHIMGYGHRYFFPIVPVLAFLAGLGAAGKGGAGPSPGVAAALLACLALSFGLGTFKTLSVVPDYLAYARGLASAHVPLGRGLAAVPWKGHPLIAIGDAGAVPYYSQLPTLDTFGLNDPVIAMHSGSDRTSYVLARKPTLVVLISQDEHEFHSPLPYEDALWRALVSHGYIRHATLICGERYFLWVVWKPDLPDAPVLERVLKDISRKSREVRRS